MATTVTFDPSTLAILPHSTESERGTRLCVRLASESESGIRSTVGEVITYCS